MRRAEDFYRFKEYCVGGGVGRHLGNRVADDFTICVTDVRADIGRVTDRRGASGNAGNNGRRLCFIDEVQGDSIDVLFFQLIDILCAVCAGRGITDRNIFHCIPADGAALSSDRRQVLQIVNGR